MSCVRSLLLLVFCCASVPADTVILRGSQAWYLEDGKTVAQPVAEVIRLGGPVDPTDPTDPPVDPIDPPNVSELELLSSTWVTKVTLYSKRDSHRQGLMAMYGVLADQVDAGSFSDLVELAERSREIQTLILGADKSRWVSWGNDINAYLDAHLSSLDGAAPAYRAVSAGLEVPGEAIDSGWVKLIEIIIEALGEGVIPPVMLALIRILLEILGG